MFALFIFADLLKQLFCIALRGGFCSRISLQLILSRYFGRFPQVNKYERTVNVSQKGARVYCKQHAINNADIDANCTLCVNCRVMGAGAVATPCQMTDAASFCFTPLEREQGGK